ncbi:Carbamoyl-phosphate synthase L chain, ATP binding domain protein [Aeromicrobium marinum DSM 15272]|uniref:Carbamoyl-phosphate synthase L chain, ATP binding domain protein n=1 Tax=Aeromicrobium marinum DSM 15272 TaxID=585531 RepID=E2S8V6_9ACTN|nr:biotin carboxylase N-terminal domain-containing protein [Aeromicrobium marinum]EFQ84611.1 Carbamoyl-phosphate synthase L chain, ATP binding domain protein [Aeromicrobium marinum DSM 15272]
MTLSRVLVANRGEIARRVLRACREERIGTVAVFTPADASATFVTEADVAVEVDSYLDIDAIVAAAVRHGADAVNPGYGFLAERAAFARAVTDAGLVFVGPSADVIEALGRKDHARAIAERAGVPVMPHHDAGAVPAYAYPVLVKAAAGGGGKGMRIVRSADELPAAIEAAGREAASAFGDDTLLVEAYVEHGRHVEVQVFGDSRGQVVHLFDRDCSAQRRHQKVVEEAPAPDLDPELRRQLHESSVALCREVGYVGAGTVEFLVAPAADGTSRAYFLEMNTRLQVEHPVTEAVTGVDLVRWQLDVAAGYPLALTQDEITVRGHAVEVRIYAEDPYAGFLPQTGRVEQLRWPLGARVEADLVPGREVGTAYDPMLAKLIVSGPDREQARRQMVRALDDLVLTGVVTNTGFLRRFVAGAEFTAGPVDTGWLDRSDAAELLTRPEAPDEVVRAAAIAWSAGQARGGGPLGTADGWRVGGPPTAARVDLVDAAGDAHRVEVPSGSGTGLRTFVGTDVVVSHEAQTWRFARPDPMRGDRRAAAAVADVTAPMPGTVLAIDVEVGDRVTGGARVAVVEAMKMEIALTAPYDGVVSHVGSEPGRQVPLGHVLVTVDPDE